MRPTLTFVTIVFAFLSSIMAQHKSNFIEPQARSVAGKYAYKTHREGKGGFENYLEVENKGNGKLYISFSGTYFYRAGRDETFHEGNGEGDGRLKGNVATAILTEEGGDGKCKVTLTFGNNQVTVKSVNCDLNVSPDGVYKREIKQRLLR